MIHDTLFEPGRGFFTFFRTDRERVAIRAFDVAFVAYQMTLVGHSQNKDSSWRSGLRLKEAKWELDYATFEAFGYYGWGDGYVSSITAFSKPVRQSFEYLAYMEECRQETLKNKTLV